MCLRWSELAKFEQWLGVLTWCDRLVLEQAEQGFVSHINLPAML